MYHGHFKKEESALKHFRRGIGLLLVLVMAFSMMGCGQSSAAITVPKGHVPTISENIASLAQSSNSTVTSRKYYYVDSVAERGTGNIVSEAGKGVSVGKVSCLWLHRVSNLNERITYSGDFVYPGGSQIKVGQECCLVTMENRSFGGISYTYLVFGG